MCIKSANHLTDLMYFGYICKCIKGTLLYHVICKHYWMPEIPVTLIISQIRYARLSYSLWSWRNHFGRSFVWKISKLYGTHRIRFFALYTTISVSVSSIAETEREWKLHLHTIVFDFIISTKINGISFEGERKRRGKIHQ